MFWRINSAAWMFGNSVHPERAACRGIFVSRFHAPILPFCALISTGKFRGRGASAKE
jgi:hypothetical protein